MSKNDSIIASKQKNCNGLIEKINDTVLYLTFENNGKGEFIERINHLGLLLNTCDVPLSTTIQTVDRKGQDLVTYFVAAYSDTKDVDQALSVYSLIKQLVRFVLLSDRFHEVGSKSHNLLANQVRRSIIEITAQANDKCLCHSIDFALEQFWSFWKFEELMKSWMFKGHSFSYNETRRHNLFKSSDTAIYARVLEAELPNFNENVSLILHYNQALLDLEDDFDDIEEDVREAMPNVFVMAATESISYEKIRKMKYSNVRNLVLNGSGSKEYILRLIKEYSTSIRGISLPHSFEFLKLLSDHYVDRLRASILCFPTIVLK